MESSLDDALQYYSMPGVTYDHVRTRYNLMGGKVETVFGSMPEFDEVNRNKRAERAKLAGIGRSMIHGTLGANPPGKRTLDRAVEMLSNGHSPMEIAEQLKFNVNGVPNEHYSIWLLKKHVTDSEYGRKAYVAFQRSHGRSLDEEEITIDKLSDAVSGLSGDALKKALGVEDVTLPDFIVKALNERRDYEQKIKAIDEFIASYMKYSAD